MRKGVLAGLTALLLAGITRDPFPGSAIVYRDNGPARNGPAPLANTPPHQGKDSHYAPRTTPAARTQKSDFLLTGNVVDVCGGKPCQASGATSP